MKNIFQTDFDRYKLDVWLLIFRILIAGFMLTHGLPKFVRLMSGDFQFADPIGIGEMSTLLLAVFAEVVCSTFILIGLGTRLATVPLIATMLVAAFIAHWNEPFGKKELPLVYLFVYITLLVLGSGKYSLDFFISRRLTQLMKENGRS